MSAGSQRIAFLDIMRGVAVVVMVVGHSIDAVLSREVRASELFQLYDAVRGFTAPIFLFVAGFAFSVSSEKRWADLHSLGRPVTRRLSRFLGLLAIGYALHIPFFSLDKLLHNTTPAEYAQMYQADVLHCLAVSMILLQLGLFLVKTPRVFALFSLSLAGVIVFASPFLWQARIASTVSPVLAPYLNGLVPSIFPLFPYAGFVFTGVGVGHFYLDARRSGREQVFHHGLVIIALTAVVVGLVFDLLPWSAYPAHDFWKASPDFFLIRIGAVGIVTAGFISLRRIPSTVSSRLVTLGQASLLIYVAHLVIVYGSPANPGLMQTVGQVLPVVQALTLAGTVLAGMFLTVRIWQYVRAQHLPVARFAQAATTSMLLFYFITRPW
jgi:acyltransferase